MLTFNQYLDKVGLSYLKVTAELPKAAHWSRWYNQHGGGIEYQHEYYMIFDDAWQAWRDGGFNQ